MKLSRIIEFVRFEAGFKGNDSVVGFIVQLLTEILREYTALEYYSALKRRNVSISPSVPGEPNFTLPMDLQHFLSDRIRYSNTGNLQDSRFLYQGEVLDDLSGTPIRYDRAGNVLTVWPQTIDSTGVLIIDYYKIPEPFNILADETEFPIPELELTVKLEAVSRLSRLSESDKSQDFLRQSLTAFSRSQGAK